MSTLVLGLSTRALSESAVRCGHNIFTLDYFGDQDQKAIVENYSLARDFQQPFSAENLFKASEYLDFDSVIYTSNLENHPKVVEKLARRSSLLGNTAEVLCKVRDWNVLREFCRNNSISHPLTLLAGEEKQTIPEFQWLCKPAYGGGGSGIHPWSGSLINDSHVLQERVDGLSASATFVADGTKGVVLGLTQQFIGQHEFGADGYTWCGNILPLPLEPDQNLYIIEEVEKMVNQLVRHFALKGICGIDLVISSGSDNELTPFLIEINPRYTGSMELIERAYGLNIYSLHLKAFNGSLPEFLLSDYLPGPQMDKCYGKGIVFAPESVRIQNTHGWAEQGRKDIPFQGDKIAKGKPVCSILTKGETHKECLTNLFTGAKNLRQEIYKT
jgi:predicted ATP-grasp superfamily ATP-dependent carboligase